jgi:fibronectin type 3 domain-containing protein
MKLSTQFILGMVAAWSVLMSGTAFGAPPAPESLTSTPADGQVTLNWEASVGAASYTVYRNPVIEHGYAGYTVIASAVVGTTYLDTGLSNGDGYYYYVTASDGVPDESGPSLEVAAIVQPAPPTPRKGSLSYVIPKPVSTQPTGSEFVLGAGADIYVSEESGVSGIGDKLAAVMRTSTGYQLDVIPTSSQPASGHIYLLIDGSYEPSRPEAYQLEITPTLVTIRANSNAGLYWGTQTLRQVMPWQIEYRSAAFSGATWRIPTGVIDDYPRFAHRGDLLDVSVFLTLDELKKLIDLKSYYKKNSLQLKFATAAGWRMSIDGISSAYTSNLADEHYTEAEMVELVAYAEERQVKIYPQFKFKDTPEYFQEIVDACAAIFNGPYFHNGANPDDGTAPPQSYITETETIVEAAGLITIGWQEMGMLTMSPTSVVQQWRTDWRGTMEALAQGNSVIVSNGYNAYYDMGYNGDTWFQAWAGTNPTDDCYNWDPTSPSKRGNLVQNIPESQILGVEGIHFVRTSWTKGEFWFMGYPRSLCVDELSWSPRIGRTWDEFKIRLGQHGNRLVCQDVIFYESKLLTWDLWHSPTPEPAGLVALGTVGQVDLDWNGISTGDLDSYNVYRSTTQGGPYNTSIASGLTVSEYTDATTTDGTTYYYVVTSVDTGAAESGYSNEAIARPPVAPIVANSAATDVGSAIATLNGNVNETGGEFPEVTIHWGDNDAGTGTWDHTATLGLRDEGAFSADLSGLTPATTYHFRSFGQNAAGTDWADSTLSFTTLPATPAAPANLASLAGIGQVALDWDDSPLPDFSSFKVHRSSTPGGPYTMIAEDLAASGYSDTAVNSGVSYHYVVTVINTLGNESGYSSERSGTVGSGSASVLVNLDSGGRIEEGGGYSNGNIFLDWTLYPGSVTGGATTTQLVPWDYDRDIDTGTMTLQVDDRGWGGSGAVFTFEFEVHMFNDGPGTSNVNEGGGLAADSTNMADDNDRTEAAPAGGGREYMTARITKLTPVSGPSVSLGGFSALMLKWLDAAADAGILYAEGDGTKTVIGTWDDSNFKQLVNADGVAAVTVEPTGDSFLMQGFTGIFEVSSGPVSGPAVTNDPATAIAQTTATIGGHVVSTGGDVPDVTLYWGDEDGGTSGPWDQEVSLGKRRGPSVRP